MAHSLETRVPFLDNDLVDFAQRVPVGMKLGEPRRGRAAQRERARAEDEAALRAHARRQAPVAQGDGAVRAAPVVADGASRASPRPTPAGSGAKASTTSAERCSTATPRSTTIWTGRTVHGLIDEHLSGRANHRLLIWSLLSVEQWCRTFLLGERPSRRALALVSRCQMPG